MTKPKQNPHTGHRERLKKRFRTHGLQSLALHNALELLLCYAIPRRDVNEQAHALVDTFGSLSGILDAPPEELCKIHGISENAATLLKLIPAFCQLYYEEKVADAPQQAENLTQYLAEKLIARYIAEVNEVAYVICLDNRLRVLCFEKLGEGTNDSVSILTRKIVEVAIRCNASSVILAHNHPTGLAVPSQRDRQTTLQIYNALAGVSIKLLDHIVVARSDYSSMAGSGMLSTAMLGSAPRSSGSFGEEQPWLQPDGDYDWREPVEE